MINETSENSGPCGNIRDDDSVVSSSDVAGNECDTGSGSELSQEQVTASLAEAGLLPLENCDMAESADPRLKPGIPVMDIGVTEQDAINFGLLKSQEDYKAEEAARIASLEAMPHQQMFMESTVDLVYQIRRSLRAAIDLGDVTNQVYGKFMTLGMAEHAEVLRAMNTSIHFNKIIELLEQAKAHAILLRSEIHDSIVTDQPEN